MHESEKWKWSCSVVSDCLRPCGLELTRLLRPWDFPGKSTGAGCHCLLRLLVMREIQIKIIRHHHESIRMAKLKDKGIKNIAKDAGQLELLFLAAGNVKWCNFFGKHFGNFFYFHPVLLRYNWHIYVLSCSVMSDSLWPLQTVTHQPFCPHWSEMPFPLSGDLPNPGLNLPLLLLLHWHVDSTTELPGNPHKWHIAVYKFMVYNIMI